MGNINDSVSSYEITNKHDTDEIRSVIKSSREIFHGVKNEDRTFEQCSTSFLWVVKNIINYPKMVISLGEVKTKSGTKFSIELLRNPSYVVVLIVAGDFNNETKITLEASIINPYVDTRSVEFTDKETTSSLLCGFTIGEEDYLLGGQHFVLYCEFKSVVEKSHANIPNEGFFHSHFLIGMRALLEECPFYDLVMRVKGKEFLCHKAILASRSQYFKELFQKNAGKVEENRFVLQDIEPNIFEKVLRFVYTGELELPKDNILQMLAAADRFQLKTIKDACEEKLHSCLTFRNMFKMYKVACDFDLQYLKQRALLGLATFEKYVKSGTQDTTSSHSGRPQLNFAHHFSDSIDKTAWNAYESDSSTLFEPDSDDGSLPRLGGNFPIADVWYVTEEPIILRGVWRFSIPHETTFTQSASQDKREHYFIDRERGLKCMMEVHIKGSNSATSEGERCEPDANTDLETFELNLLVLSSPYPTADIDYKFFFEADTEEVFKVTGSQRFEEGKRLQIMSKKTSEVPSFNGRTVRMQYSFLARKTFCHLERPVDPQNNVIKDLSSLRTEGTYTDLTVRVQETEFHCHKAIVGYWSPLLRRKIEELPETSDISLDDIDPQSFEKFLSFVYSGRFEVADIESGNLLSCLQTFEMKPLQTPYEEYLKNNITVINVLTVYEYSEKYSMKLQKVCVEFVAKRFSEIVNYHESNGQLENVRLVSAVLEQMRNTSRD